MSPVRMPQVEFNTTNGYYYKLIDTGPDKCLSDQAFELAYNGLMISCQAMDAERVSHRVIDPSEEQAAMALFTWFVAQKRDADGDIRSVDELRSAWHDLVDEAGGYLRRSTIFASTTRMHRMVFGLHRSGDGLKRGYDSELDDDY